jgi:hypothetical protein
MNRRPSKVASLNVERLREKFPQAKRDLFLDFLLGPPPFKYCSYRNTT